MMYGTYGPTKKDEKRRKVLQKRRKLPLILKSFSFQFFGE